MALWRSQSGISGRGIEDVFLPSFLFPGGREKKGVFGLSEVTGRGTLRAYYYVESVGRDSISE